MRAPGAARAGGAILRAHLSIWAQYRMNVVVWTLATLVSVVVSLGIWQAVARANGGAYAGIDAAAFAGYFAVLAMVLELSGGSMMAQHIPHEVQRGDMSTKLVRPQHPIIYYAFQNIALKVQFVVVGAVLGVGVFVLFDARIAGSAADIAAAALLLPFAVIQVFLLESCIGCLGFVLIQIRGIRSVYIMVRMLLGGMFAPLAVFPESVRSVGELLPFWWSVGYPAQLASGGREAVQHSPLHAAAVLAAWCVVSLAVLRVAWPAGVRRYGAVGA